MGSRSAVALLVALLATALWALLKETYLAIAVEAAIEHLAEAIGVPRPTMIAAVTPYALAVAAAMAVTYAAYGIGVRDRLAAPDFDIEFDPQDNRCLDIGHPSIGYSILLRNRSSQTIAWPSIQARITPFTDQMLEGVDPYNWGQPIGAKFVFVGGAIDPDARLQIKLFDLPADEQYFAHPQLLARVHRFTLEVHGRHARTYRAEFEYNPSVFPRIRKC
jgi:hypothetical protein